MTCNRDAFQCIFKGMSVISSRGGTRLESVYKEGIVITGRLYDVPNGFIVSTRGDKQGGSKHFWNEPDA
ncbi:MAG: hypothetical protein ACQEXX_13405 [Bacillota bacterium]